MAVAAPRVDARDGCQTRSCEERVARKQCSQVRVVPCIRRAALHWRVDFSMLLRKARCESGLNPYAINGLPRNRVPISMAALLGRSAGVMQFIPSTWGTTPYAGRSIWSAEWSSLAAGWMHHVNRGSEWSCR